MTPSLFHYLDMAPLLFRYGAFVMAPSLFRNLFMSPRNNEKTKWHNSATIDLFMLRLIEAGSAHLHSSEMYTIVKYSGKKISFHVRCCVNLLTTITLEYGYNLQSLWRQIAFGNVGTCSYPFSIQESWQFKISVFASLKARLGILCSSCRSSASVFVHPFVGRIALYFEYKYIVQKLSY